MKKFFLSVALMLATISMNANATEKLGDSVIFHYTSEELYNMMVANPDFQSQVAGEVADLMWNYDREYDSWGNCMINERFYQVLKGGLMDVIDYLKQMKAEEDANADDELSGLIRVSILRLIEYSSHHCSFPRTVVGGLFSGGLFGGRSPFLRTDCE